MISERIKNISESVTLKLNSKIVQMVEDGHQVYNLTAGQLPFRPMKEFVDLMRGELNFLKSFQYGPVQGMKTLREKVLSYIQKTRSVDFSIVEEGMDCIVSNGGKQCLYNTLATLLNPKDEVILLTPYWVSYPQMIRACDGVAVCIGASIYNGFVPSIEEIKNSITEKTKVIILNSPNNPSGIHYSQEWMKDFAKLLLEYPQIFVISDEIYFEISYFDPAPTYFYQYEPKLLERTIIVDGISKTLACTGLRIGYTIAKSSLIKAMIKFQGQTTSGANSLVQRALVNFDFSKVAYYLDPIKKHLRENSRILREALRDHRLPNCWYQTLSAFYFLIDFTATPCFDNYNTQNVEKRSEKMTDYSTQICEDLLNQHQVAIVPGTDFGIPNSARISLVMETEQFIQATQLLCKFLSQSPSQ